MTRRRSIATAEPRPRFRWSSLFRAGWTPGRWSYALGYDVECSVDGWRSRTGGAIRASVLDAIDDHLLHAHGLVAIDGRVIAEVGS